jgi:hypothetical protein
LPDTTQPVIRVCFRDEPSWSSLALLQAFAYDASIVFNQALEVTDAYYGCFEVDFLLSETTPAALSLIKDKIDSPSDFDSLVAKYNILRVTLFNWDLNQPGEPWTFYPSEYMMCFDAPVATVSSH